MILYSKSFNTFAIDLPGHGSSSKNISKGDIIYWKGHVAVCLSRNKLIHAYGPRKKVLIMNIKKTIELINKTAKLKVKKIIRI